MKHYHTNKYFSLWCQVLIIGIVLLRSLMWPSHVLAEETRLADDLTNLLTTEMGFSERDLKNLSNGGVVTKQVDTSIKQEVMVVSAAQINVPEVFFLQHYQDHKFNLETATADLWERFSQSPTLADVEALTIPAIDLEELDKCRIGACKLKAPAALIEAFGQVDFAAKDAQQQAEAVLRQAIVAIVQNYLQAGNAALIEYQDQKKPLNMKEEFADLLTQSQSVQQYMPDVFDYLRVFPNATLPDSTSEIYWMVEQFGGKAKRPTLTVTHRVFFVPREGELIVAAKQLYANHYYEAALGITIMLRRPDTPDTSVTLLHINWSRIDALRKLPRMFTGELYSATQEWLHAKMVHVKNQMETLYQTK